MAIFDLYSKRQKRLRGEVPDVYSYDDLPSPLRVQIWQNVEEALGSYTAYSRIQRVQVRYEAVVELLRREYGVFQLPTSRPTSDKFQELRAFFLGCEDTEQCMDVVELCTRSIEASAKHDQDGMVRKRAQSALEEINVRFKEHGIGYQFVDGEIIRIDSELIHTEAVKPALRLLNTKDYAGPHSEFLSAYEHYRHGKNKEALNDCLKAFESTMKAICDKRGWTYQPGDTAKKLIAVCFSEGLIPSFWQAQFTHLQGLLESSVPTGRNKLSGHGQGAVPQTVPDHITAYMLHMTASTLVFLTTAEKELP